MARILAAVGAGALVYYVWGMLAWMVVPLHTGSVHGLPDEQLILDAVQTQNLESGVYVAPFTDDSAAMGDPESEFSKKHRAGPILSLYVRKSGLEPMGVGVLLGGLLIDLLASGLAVCMLLGLGSCGRNFWCRVGFVTGLGVFVAIVGHVSYWNWMYFPLDYTVAFVVDVVVGWTLAGLAIAALIKPGAVPFMDVAPGEAAERSSDASPKLKEEKPRPAPSAAVKEAKPSVPSRNDAISLLAALQREARFVDIVKEPLGDYSDAQVGAAARDVLRDCGAVIDRLFKIQPVVQQEDGAEVSLQGNQLRPKIKVTGNADEDAQSGILVHHGWEAGQCDLPSWTGTQEMALVIAPAEVEVK